jgi:hypothetical protein
VTYWLLMERAEVTACRHPPRPENDLVVRADVGALYKVLMGQLSCAARGSRLVVVEGRRPVRGFLDDWFSGTLLRLSATHPGLAFPGVEPATATAP